MPSFSFWFSISNTFHFPHVSDRYLSFSILSCCKYVTNVDVILLFVHDVNRNVAGNFEFIDPADGTNSSK